MLSRLALVCGNGTVMSGAKNCRSVEPPTDPCARNLRTVEVGSLERAIRYAQLHGAAPRLIPGTAVADTRKGGTTL